MKGELTYMTRTEQIMELVASLHGQSLEELEAELGVETEGLDMLVGWIVDRMEHSPKN